MSLLTRFERGVDGAGELAFEAADRFASALALVRAAASFAKSVTTGITCSLVSITETA